MKKCENITCSKCIYVYVKYNIYVWCSDYMICASLINIYTVKRCRKFEDTGLELASTLVGYIPHTLRKAEKNPQRNGSILEKLLPGNNQLQNPRKILSWEQLKMGSQRVPGVRGERPMSPKPRQQRPWQLGWSGGPQQWWSYVKHLFKSPIGFPWDWYINLLTFKRYIKQM